MTINLIQATTLVAVWIIISCLAQLGVAFPRWAVVIAAVCGLIGAVLLVLGR